MPQAKINNSAEQNSTTMAQSVKLLILLPALLLLLVPVQGARPAVSPSPKCAASSVTVEQTNTGEKAGYDPVFEVTVRNTCGCAVRAVYLRSEGFASSVAVDPRLFRREGRDYLVGDGRRIEAASAVRFRYAWDRAFRMTAAAVHDDCS
ncbi:hypothetical protein BAE44_0012886 [Dichanthelium oligosanthes]|uniref:Uncharacterized protein n=1 Tax=Dichanthelium oligosanthes TaxID=888268 RepID=A0A1E5VLT8_9POAL|nr:hypothetical protein BAE44_0012886 [Dichanthelium oligosanthes]